MMKAIICDYGELSITPMIRLWLCDNYSVVCLCHYNISLNLYNNFRYKINFNGQLWENGLLYIGQMRSDIIAIWE